MQSLSLFLSITFYIFLSVSFPFTFLLYFQKHTLSVSNFFFLSVSHYLSLTRKHTHKHTHTHPHTHTHTHTQTHALTLDRARYCQVFAHSIQFDIACCLEISLQLFAFSFTPNSSFFQHIRPLFCCSVCVCVISIGLFDLKIKVERTKENFLSYFANLLSQMFSPRFY